jgi:hypothetical protein
VSFKCVGDWPSALKHGEVAAFYLLHAAESLVGQLLLMLVLKGELSILSLTLLLSHLGLGQA